MGVLICRLFEFFVSILDLFVQNARLEGQFDSGIADLKANTIKLKGLPKVTTLLQLLFGFNVII